MRARPTKVPQAKTVQATTTAAARTAPAWGALVGLVLALGAAAPAEASPETLKRSVGNIVFAPFDFVLTPVVGANTMYNNLRDIDDSLGVRVAYPIPGYAWNCMALSQASIIRFITGGLELVPGLLLLPFRADLDPLYAPIERGNALVDVETPVIRVKFGVDYLTVPY